MLPTNNDEKEIGPSPCYPDNMKRDLLDILACPACKAHPLELTVEKEEGKEILEGRLKCPKCGRTYPIQKSIPNMLVKD
jgi:uncharacterized protein YbaR (Trm112 family)